MDRGAWWATVHGATKSWTWLNAHTHSETPASREHEDTHLGILFLLPVKEHKQRSPLVHLHDDLSPPPSFVLDRLHFRLRGAVTLPAVGFCAHCHHLRRFPRCLAWQYWRVFLWSSRAIGNFSLSLPEMIACSKIQGLCSVALILV